MFDIGTGSLVATDALVIGNTPRVSAKSENNGIIGFFETEGLNEARHFENFISVNFFGADGGVFYHPYKASVEMKVHTLKIPNHEFNSKTGNFIATCLKKNLGGFSYGNQLSSSKLKQLDLKVQLPTKNNKINFKFMESFIAELEAQRIAELEAYLDATGLNDYQLTSDEKTALKDLGNKQFKTFNLELLFGKSTRGKRLKSADRISGTLPFVTAGEANTGISSYISNGVDVFEANTITIDMFGSAKYRNYQYGGDDHIAVVHTQALNPMSVLFITAAIHKASYNGQFNYGRNFYAKDADSLNILLPEKNGQPDFEFMNILISAAQKLVIQDVVDYADRNIALTQKAISK